jgi:hypothetical protein
MKNASLRASIESIAYEDREGEERWSYSVTAGPMGTTDKCVSGIVWWDGRGGAEVGQVDLNSLGLPDDLARRFLIVIFRGLFGRMQDADGNIARYITPDCSEWINGRMYRIDTSRILRALSQFSKMVEEFESTLWVSQ